MLTRPTTHTHYTTPRNWTSRLAVLGLGTFLALGSAACSSDGGGSGPGPDVDPDSPEVGETEFFSAGGSASGFSGGSSSGGGRGAEDDLGGTPQPGAPTDGDANEGGGGSDREVIEGDIYRVYDGDLILNLNYYRGLQLIDVSDVANPVVVGRTAAVGTPNEMYVTGNFALVLLNNYRSYYRGASAFEAESYEGGFLLAVDLSDPNNPEVVSRHPVPGNIQTSRLTTSGSADALYVVSSRYEWENSGGGADEPAVGAPGGGAVSNDGHKTFVTSFDVTNPAAIGEVAEVDLGGWVADIYAGTEALVVSRQDYSGRFDRLESRLQYIDISDPAGALVQGAEVEVDGEVRSKFNMNVEGGILRVFSHDWEQERSNTLTTFDFSDIQNPVKVEDYSFAPGENLFATLFLGHKAFAVTYEQVDPFHAFEITPEGNIFERAEFIVSGWNNFFKPAMDETRLVGIGIDDAGGTRKVAVSLYDITELTNPEPLVDREAVEAEWSHSSANWDDKAFTVLEGVVDADGETGLALVPYSGWNEDDGRPFSGVQLFTFGADSVTRRGTLDHGTEVRRSFVANDHIANLSEVELSLYDFSDVNTPSQVSTLELAPNNSGFFDIGDGFGVKRVEDDPWWWYGGWSDDQATHATVDLRAIRLDSGDPDTAEVLSEISLPAGVQTVQVGKLIVAIATDWRSEPAETTLTVYDFTNPSTPVERGTVTTEANLSGAYYGCDYYGCYDDVRGGVADGGGGEVPPTTGDVAEPAPAPDVEVEEDGGTDVDTPASGEARQGLRSADVAPGYYGRTSVPALVLGSHALAFLSPKQERESLGNVSECWFSYEDPENNCAMGGGSSGGGWGGSAGSDGAPPAVPTEPADAPDEGGDGEFMEPPDGERDFEDEERYEDEPHYEEACGYVSEGAWCVQPEGEEELCEGELKFCNYNGDCEDIPLDAPGVQRHCDTYERFRSWQSYSVNVLDLSDPDNPAFRDAVALNREHTVAGYFAEGNTLYVTTRDSGTIADNLVWFRYYAQAINVASGAAPEVGPAINIPGVLVSVADEGSTLFTQDFRYSPYEYEMTTSLNRLSVDGGVARLEARREFEDQQVASIHFDDNGHAYVAHRMSYQAAQRRYGDDYWNEADYGQTTLSVLDLGTDDLGDVASLPLENWASLNKVEGDRAFFNVPDGVLLVDVSTPASPALQSFFFTRGWPQQIVVNEEAAYLPAGRFGLYSLDLDTVTIDATLR